MNNAAGESQVLVFGIFEADLKSGELRKAGMRVHLPPQPFEALQVLLEHPQQIITHEEFRHRLWPDSTFVDYDLALKRIINRLRTVLGDSADNPIFIETIPRQGYRFIAPLTKRDTAVVADLEEGATTHPPSGSGDTQATGHSGSKTNAWVKIWVISGGITALVAVVFLLVRAPISRYYNNRGVRLQHRGDLKVAIENYRLAILLKPDYAEAHYNLGDVYEEIPDYDRAVQEYKNAIDADLTFYEAYNNLSRLYILRYRDYAGALKLLERAMNLQPKEPSVQYSLYKNYGWAAFELHQLVQAHQSLKSAVALGPERGAAHCLLAKVFDAQGKNTDALAEWGSCLADASPSEVEPEWRIQAQDRLRRESVK